MVERIRGVRAELAGGAENLMFVDDAAERLEKLGGEFGGKVSLIYMDPPFTTGKRFEMKLKIGAREWKSGNGSACVTAYEDKLDMGEYLHMMRRVLEASKQLMSEDALIFIHIDWRASAHIRLMADEIFGESNFVNEIVWTYDTGGRSKKFFPRKHDTILLYAKSPQYDLHIDDVAEIPREGRKNHMARKIDEDGRSYRYITSGGKTYRYYDDEPVPPSDVWDDVSHLQQKDPQRTGYATQKPLRLLERIVKCASREGDIVLDPFSGSGVTAEAAAMWGRRFIAIDQNPICAELIRRRIDKAPCLYEFSESEGDFEISAERVSRIVDSDVYLNGAFVDEALTELTQNGFDAIDGWAVGVMSEGRFVSMSSEQRSRTKPELSFKLRCPVLYEPIAIRVSDILGRRFFYSL